MMLLGTWEFVVIVLLLVMICRELYRLTGLGLQSTGNAITYTMYSRIRELACMLG